MPFSREPIPGSDRKNEAASRSFRVAETERLVVLAVVAAWLLHPFATSHQVGAGDALWYANMLADFVTQWRGGVFPSFVGQTAFAFNGAVYPLRVAPLYQHLAGILDLATNHRLGFFALQHLVVIVCGVSALYGCYFALTSVVPRRRWSAAAFAVLYLSCPGLLATIYTQDLYMTWMTVPFIPLAFYGIVRTFQRDDLASQCWLGASLAALWWGHSPIALWTTALAGLTQLVRLAWIGCDRGAWVRSLTGAGIFACLAQYPFVSLHLVHAPDTPSAVATSLAHAGDITTNLHAVFPAILLPLTPNAGALSDLQLGYALWVTLVAASLASILLPRTQERFALRLLLVGAAILLLLLLPVPGVTDFAWTHMPGTIKRITYYWPMQRFYPILAALLAFCGQLALGSWTAVRRRSIIIGISLSIGCAWSLWESRQFIQAGLARTSDQASSLRAQRPENLMLTDHSYGLFAALPPYFSNGVMDPRFEVRLLQSEASGNPGNASTVDAGSFIAVATGELHGSLDANPGILNLSPAIRLAPGQSYALTIEFAKREYRGILQIVGHGIFREYALPVSGESRGFGSNEANSHALPLWTSGPGGDEVTLRFIPTEPGAKTEDFVDFGSYSLRQFDPAHAPVTLNSLMPFRATVRTDDSAWLETPRMYLPGYTATVDGHPVPVLPSPAGLAAIPLRPGSHAVELLFPGPLFLRVSYWLALASWAAVLTALAAQIRPRQNTA